MSVDSGFAVWLGWGLLGMAMACAVADWIAVAYRRRWLIFVFKPLTMVLLLLGGGLLALTSPHNARLTAWILAGLFCSLVGDVFLMISHQRFFVPGMLAFFAAHGCYILGFNPTWPPLVSLLLLLPLTALGVQLYRHIAPGIKPSLRIPVAVYAMVLALMLFSAWTTLFRPAWPSLGRGAAIVGASLFFLSDVLWAQNEFVHESAPRHVWGLVSYHLAQLGLVLAMLWS